MGTAFLFYKNATTLHACLQNPLPLLTVRWFVVAISLLTVFSGKADDKVWTGAAIPSGQWQNAANWGGLVPSAHDSLVFDGNTQTATTNNFPSLTAFEGIKFNSGASAFTLRGNGITISCATNGSNVGIVNNSAAAQSVYLDLNLNWGLYRFTNAPLASLNLNGTGTAAFGAVAWFGPGTVSSASWANEGTGLISDLGGAALIGVMGTGNGFSDLASINGGIVSAYTYPASAQFNSNGMIGANSSSTLTNLELHGTAAFTTAYDLIGGNSSTFVSTILVRGNWGGVGSELLIGTNALGGTLVLGTPIGHSLAALNPSIGGIYFPNPSSVNSELVRVFPYKLTAGQMSGSPVGGELILGVNGTSSTVQMEVVAMIVNNGSGGAVSVTKTGTGVLNLNPHNGPSTYSGGTYVNQGYLQASTTNSLGRGSVYVASGATVSLTGAGGTWTNNFFISPGVGAFQSGGAITTRNSSTTLPQTLSGMLTLLGRRATNGSGCRIAAATSGSTTILAGRITGTGTLDLLNTDFGNPAIFILSNATANANSWTGGILVNSRSNYSVTVRVRASNQLATNNVTLLQSGSETALLDLSGFNETISGLSSLASLQNRITNSGAACTLTFGANDASADFGGSFYSTLNLVKTGNGTQILSGTNNNTGTFYLNEGKLALNGRLPISCALVTQPGTVLTGFGLGFGPSLISGTVAPGETNQVGTLRVGSLTLSNAVLIADLQNGTNDLLKAGVNLFLYGTNFIQPVPVPNNLSSGQQITLITYSGALSGTSNNFAVLPSLPGYSFSLVDPATTPGSIKLTVDSVPAKPQPVITSFSLSGTNLVLAGTNAVAGGTYYVLMSTNVAQPLSDWTVMLSNLWSGGANFMLTATNAVSPTAAQRYYILQVR